MPSPERGSLSSIVDCSFNPVLVSDLDQEVLKELMAKMCGLTVHDLKRRTSQHASVTTTRADSCNELETFAVSPPTDGADGHLIEITNTTAQPGGVDYEAQWLLGPGTCGRSGSGIHYSGVL